jgi:hypothetical protein
LQFEVLARHDEPAKALAFEVYHDDAAFDTASECVVNRSVAQRNGSVTFEAVGNMVRTAKGEDPLLHFHARNQPLR